MSFTVPIRYVRAAVVVAANQEWDVAAILAEADVSPLLMADPRSRVTDEQMARITQAMWRATDDELLGLSPAPVPRGTFRLISHGLLTAKDGRELARRMERFTGPLPGIPPMRVVVGDDVVRFEIDPGQFPGEGGLVVDALLAVAHRFVEWLMKARVPLVAVHVPYPQPSDLSAYPGLFGITPTFDSSQTALVLDAAFLDRPLMRTEDELESFLANAPAGILGRREGESSIVDLVRRILEVNLSAELSADEVASRLSVAAPTLRRKLREAGTSYRELREDLLRDAAIEALVHGTESIADISERLGFSEPSAFTRAFRRWTGMAPGVYRSSAT